MKTAVNYVCKVTKNIFFCRNDILRKVECYFTRLTCYSVTDNSFKYFTFTIFFHAIPAGVVMLCVMLDIILIPQSIILL
jgi:hypothetical protein